jgi:protein gp37
MNPEWVRGLRDQCQAAGVAFFFKQWGEYGLVSLSQSRHFAEAAHDLPSGQYLVRTGKKLAGRELDGRTWDEMPEVEAVLS